MQIIKKQLKQPLALLLFSTLLFAYQPVMAESDQTAIEQYQRARAANAPQKENHADHEDSTMGFHGVFYGFVPCDNCLGTKMTLSLNQNNNYLLVIQYATQGSKEIYEKGKYNWDDENHTVVLTPRKGGTNTRHYLIQDEETLAQLNDDGTKMNSTQADRHVLRRSDTVKSREIHFH